MIVAAVTTAIALNVSATPPAARVAQPPAPIASTVWAPTAGPRAVLAIPASGTLLKVPTSFLGLSTEYWTIPVWAKHLSMLGGVLSAITPNGPMVLRIGGSSADQAVYAPTRELPEWAFEITPGWLKLSRSGR